MIKYICRHCYDHECETSTCDICNKRAEVLSSAIYYCEDCNTPLFYGTCPNCQKKCKKIGTDIEVVPDRWTER